MKKTLNNQDLPKNKIKIPSKSKMYEYYFSDPKDYSVKRELYETKINYFYFKKDIIINIQKDEVLNGCLLSGDCDLFLNDEIFKLKQFDIFYVPSNNQFTLKISDKSNAEYKICLNSYKINNCDSDIELKQYNEDNFIKRGENGSQFKMATLRTVWTAIQNKYFMSGFTNIPLNSLKQGVITSVNLVENDDGNIEIYPHIHTDYPEVYIMCIDDKDYSISQYLINKNGRSICKDLSDGDGLFFPGYLGHCNFARPFYKNLKYCMYYWCIPTFGNIEIVNPITLKV